MEMAVTLAIKDRIKRNISYSGTDLLVVYQENQYILPSRIERSNFDNFDNRISQMIPELKFYFIFVVLEIMDDIHKASGTG